MTDLAAYRNHLFSVARAFAETVQARPNVVGVVAYGSLAHGDMTPFSDVDLFAVYEGGMPDYQVEHRLIDGTKVDLIAVELSALENLLVNVPTHYWKGHEVTTYALKSMLLGSPETVLFDPSGRIAHIKEELGRLTSYERLVRPASSEVFRDRVVDPIVEARKSFEAGDFDAAANGAYWAAETVLGIAKDLIPTKDLRVAAEKLGIPRLCDLDRRLRETGPDRAAVEAFWAAAHALWNRFLEEAVRPIRQKLDAAGVTDPAKLELKGQRYLFWPGQRLNEWGRVLAEFDLTLRWSRFELDRDDPAAALDILWPFRHSDDLFLRWKGIGEALGDAGCDCAEIIASLIEEDETKRMATALDDARAAEKSQIVSRETAEARIETAEELRELLAGAYPFMAPEELPRFEYFAPDEAVKLDSDALDAVVGQYDYGAGIGILTVTREDDRLFAQITGQTRAEIFPLSETEFAWKIVPARLRLIKDDEGKIVQAVHTQEGQQIDVRRIEATEQG